MKGTIFDIQRFSIHDGPGIRTTVFLKGCPLSCIWCHNPESRNPGIETFPGNIKVGTETTSEEILTEVLKDRIFYDESDGGVTFSGGEPFHQPEFLKENLLLCRQNDLHTVVDTSGYTSYDILDEIYELTDLFLFDLKIADYFKHIEYTGVSNELIINNLKKLTERGNKVIVRIPLIPKITDSKENIVGLINHLKKIKNIPEINLLKYNKIGESKYKRFGIENSFRNDNIQSEEMLNELIHLFKDFKTTVKI